MGGRSRHLLSSVRRAFAGSTRKPITGLIINDNIAPPEQLKQVATDDREEENCGEKKQKQKQKQLSLEDQAAIKIQSFFRGHLARRAFRALRSLVKLQALVRGACVRRQSRMAAHCIHALVRLHLRVRSRQLMAGNGRSEPLSA